ncbi:MAG: flavodoxin domain-containing protein [Aggregatilineales bacterium]
MTILLTYASRSGSTAEIAEAIGGTFTEHDISVDARPMTEVTGVAQYQAVVAGSAVRQQQWLPEAMQFLETHQRELVRKPVATFLVCMALATKNPTRYQNGLRAASAWMAPARQLVNPVSEGYFAGVLELKKIKELRFRIALGAMVRLGLFPEGDHRDWDAIDNWANTLPAKLMTQTAKIL